MKDNWVMPLFWGDQVSLSSEAPGIRLVVGNPGRNNSAVILSIEDAHRLAKQLMKMDAKR